MINFGYPPVTDIVSVHGGGGVRSGIVSSDLSLVRFSEHIVLPATKNFGPPFEKFLDSTESPLLEYINRFLL